MIDDVDDKRPRLLLYTAQLLAEFSSWLWAFSTVVWLSELAGPSSLYLNSSYAATQELATLLFVPWLMRSALNRKNFTASVLLAQIPCIFAASLVFAYNLGRLPGDASVPGDASEGEEDAADSDASKTSKLSLAALYLSGGIASVLQQAYLISIQRDWTVVIAKNEDKNLETINVTMKQIHLACIITVPTLAGFAAEHGGGVLPIGILKMACLVLQTGCIVKAHSILLSSDAGLMEHEESGEEVPDEPDEPGEHFDNGERESSSGSSCKVIEDLHIYRKQDMMWAGVAFALLYTNVLCFGGMMTAYLNRCGLGWDTIGIWQGLSNFSGLMGTFCFVLLQRFTSVESSLLIGLLFQFSCISIAIIGVLLARNPLMTATLMIVGVIPSRIGLWVADLATIQLFQRTVDEDLRGRVGGVQTSISSSMEFLPLALGMVFSEVADYWKVMLIGYMHVGLAVVVCGAGVWLPYRNRKLLGQVIRSESTNDDTEEAAMELT